MDAFDPDFDVYPLFAKAKYIEFEQLPGELLMIPTGWFHQVISLSISTHVDINVIFYDNRHTILRNVWRSVVRCTIARTLSEMCIIVCQVIIG